MSELKLKDKVMFITGGGDGMGKATSILAAQEGAVVAIYEIDPKKHQAVKKIIEDNGGKAITFTGDVTNEEGLRQAIDETAKKFGSIDILINNVGYCPEGLVHEMPTEEWDKTMRISLDAYYYGSKYAIPHMLAKGKGAVVNIASAAGLKPVFNTPAYCVAKAGVVMLTKAMAIAYAPSGIRVNCICPGVIDTNKSANMSPEYRQAVSNIIPMRRLGLPEEVAKAIVFLVSDDASYMNGAITCVDGAVSI